MLAVPLDIVNAFNSLHWDGIKEALARHGDPCYLRRVVGNYLSERSIEVPAEGGFKEQRAVEHGVPQGSVLGPLLWIICCSYVLETTLLTGVQLFCYADDTLVVPGGSSWDSALRRAQSVDNAVVDRIHELGLEREARPRPCGSSSRPAGRNRGG